MSKSAPYIFLSKEIFFADFLQSKLETNFCYAWPLYKMLNNNCSIWLEYIKTSKKRGPALVFMFSQSAECIRDFHWTLVKVARLLLLCHFWPLLMGATIFRAARSLLKIDLSIKPNHYNQVKLIQSTETQSTVRITNLDKLNLVEIRNSLAKADFYYCPSCLKKWCLLQKWSQLTQK